MKKILTRGMWILLFAVLLYMGYPNLVPARTVDFYGPVEEIYEDKEKGCYYIYATGELCWFDVMIEVPYRTKCRDLSGKKYNIGDIKPSNLISVDFKGEVVRSNNVNYAKAKKIIAIPVNFKKEWLESLLKTMNYFF